MQNLFVAVLLTAALQSAPPVLVVLETTAGEFEVSVDVVHAPVTAANFLKYVDEGGYSGSYVHRAVRPNTESRIDLPIQVVQASAGQTAAKHPAVPLERASVTGLKHLAGTLSMARGGSDTATSDFFVCLADTPELDFVGMRNADGQGFAAFGTVVSGMDVVKTIQQAPTKAGPDGKPSQALDPRITITSAYRTK